MEIVTGQFLSDFVAEVTSTTVSSTPKHPQENLHLIPDLKEVNSFQQN